MPLLREGVPIGVIDIVRAKQVRPFTDKQIELVTNFADQAVIAIENVRLFDEVQARTRDLSEALEQQTATSEVLQVISSSPGELEPVFQTMLENAVRICDAKFGDVLYLYDGDGIPYRRSPQGAACICREAAARAAPPPSGKPLMPRSSGRSRSSTSATLGRCRRTSKASRSLLALSTWAALARCSSYRCSRRTI